MLRLSQRTNVCSHSCRTPSTLAPDGPQPSCPMADNPSMAPTPTLRGTLRNEFLWIGAAFVVLVAVAYLVLHSMTTGTFDRLERDNISNQANRISSSLGYERALISNLVSTNSEWDDMYDAARTGDAGSLGDLLPASQMRENFGLGGMILLNGSGHIVSGAPISQNGKRYVPATPALTAAVTAPAVLSKPTTPGGTTSCGVLKGGGRYYLYCSAPVVHTTGAGPGDGALVAMEGRH